MAKLMLTKLLQTRKQRDAAAASLMQLELLSLVRSFFSCLILVATCHAMLTVFSSRVCLSCHLLTLCLSVGLCICRTSRSATRKK